MKIHLKLNGRMIPATLEDNATAREFMAMLPLTITMHDLFKREKFGPLPLAISGQGTHTRSYEVGDLICWAPGPDLTIFHRHDGQTISGACHVLGKLDFGAEEFGVPGPIEVSIDLPAPRTRIKEDLRRPGSPAPKSAAAVPRLSSVRRRTRPGSGRSVRPTEGAACHPCSGPGSSAASARCEAAS